MTYAAALAYDSVYMIAEDQRCENIKADIADNP